MALLPEQRAEPSSPEPPPNIGLVRGLVVAARPVQWVKNLLIVAAPIGAGVIDEPRALGRTLLAVLVFCIAASGGYLLNDAADVNVDRAHPRKRRRPVASGAVPVGVAVVAGCALLIVAASAAFALLGRDFGVALAAYLVLTVSYTVWLKHQPIFDIAGVAAGFLIRAIAGGVAVDVHISEWFIIVAGFCSLFVVTGKRHAEQLELGDDATDHRVTQSSYSLSFLRFVRSVSSAVAITAYCLMAFERAGDPATAMPIWFQLSIIPFVLAVLRYVLLLEHGKGAAPEEVFLEDRTLQGLGMLWAILFAAGVYG
jgi:decaprenyl-phosphate phosphoribosyltransferase